MTPRIDVDTRISTEPVISVLKAPPESSGETKKDWGDFVVPKKVTQPVKSKPKPKPKEKTGQGRGKNIERLKRVYNHGHVKEEPVSTDEEAVEVFKEKLLADEEEIEEETEEEKKEKQL